MTRLIVLLLLCASANDSLAQSKSKPNVLFIVVDDLRTELNCYGASHMVTPSIDRLAESGVIFQRAYCQQAVCAPSRNSFLTGLRPDELGIYDLQTFFRANVPDVVTLPQHFKNNGYRTEAVGKIFHTGHGNKDDVRSWSVPKWNEQKIVKSIPAIQNGDTTGLESDYPHINNVKLPFHRSAAPEENMTDAVIARIASDRIKALKDSSFFLAVGFRKPHLPFVAPGKYWDLYDPGMIGIPGRVIPIDMAAFALTNFGELRKYYGIRQKGPLNDETSRNLIHAYYAAVSMIDAQVGRLLEALKDNGVLDNTIVVLLGDHGWKLGEYGSWCKHSNFEMDTNVPLIISGPGISGKMSTSSLAELVDVYPTLCDLAGLSKPDHLGGVSLLPVLNNAKSEVREVAISQFPRTVKLAGETKMTEVMGYTMRYRNYRYVRWHKAENPEEVVFIELYDHFQGKVAVENLAKNENYQILVREMDRLLLDELNRVNFFYARRKPR